MRRLAKFMSAAAAATLAGAPASAEWLKATSRHFVIYSDSSAESVRTLATRLERVDGALRRLSGAEDTVESAANPVTVYVLDDQSAVARMTGDSSVAGFYIGRANGAVAFTPRRGGGDYGLDPQIVLFHEYAHHYLLGQSHVAFPAWLSEGYAEFVSTARFTDTHVQVGVPANHRAYGLLDTAKLPIRTLLAPPAKLDGLQTEQLYGRGWLLTHYLIFAEMTAGARRGQLRRYLDAIDAGKPPLDAAAQVFGDLKTLDRELDAYLVKRRMTVANLSVAAPAADAIKVRPLTPGERALIAMRVTSTRGVGTKTAGPLYVRAARAAAPFGTDAVAQGWLAEMAFDAGKLDEADAAAGRALATDPKSVQALLYKGMIALRRAADAKLPAADPAWAAARAPIVRANRIDTNAAAPLELYYHSFEMAGAPPSKSAIAGLHRAQELAPQDDGLRFASARQSLLDGEVDAAKRTLRPLAFSPHGGADNAAARLLKMVESGAKGPAALAALEAEEKAAAEKAKPKS